MRVVFALAVLLALALPLRAADDTVLATVNGAPITEGYVYGQLGSLPLGEQVAIRQRIDHFVESLVREEALFQWMLATGFEGESELRDTVKQAVAKALIDRHVTQRIDVSESDVLEYYERNEPVIRGEYVGASLIVLDDFELCEQLHASITADDAFATKSAELSVDPEVRERRGNIGLFMPHVGPWGFEDALFEMRVGEQRMFDINGQCNLVRITQRVVPALPPIEKVERNIRLMVQREQELELLGALFERALSSVVIERPAVGE